MTNTPGNSNGQQPSRLDRIEAVLATVADQQANTQRQLDNLANRQADTQQQLDELISTANSVFARDAILNDVLLELRDSHEQQQRHFEQHQRNFEQHQRNVEENQRTTNAALDRLEAILLQIIRNSE